MPADQTSSIANQSPNTSMPIQGATPLVSDPLASAIIPDGSIPPIVDQQLMTDPVLASSPFEELIHLDTPASGADIEFDVGSIPAPLPDSPFTDAEYKIEPPLEKPDTTQEGSQQHESPFDMMGETHNNIQDPVISQGAQISQTADRSIPELAQSIPEPVMNEGISVSTETLQETPTTSSQTEQVLQSVQEESVAQALSPETIQTESIVTPPESVDTTNSQSAPIIPETSTDPMMSTEVSENIPPMIPDLPVTPSTVEIQAPLIADEASNPSSGSPESEKNIAILDPTIELSTDVGGQESSSPEGIPTESTIQTPGKSDDLMVDQSMLDQGNLTQVGGESIHDQQSDLNNVQPSSELDSAVTSLEMSPGEAMADELSPPSINTPVSDALVDDSGIQQIDTVADQSVDASDLQMPQQEEDTQSESIDPVMLPIVEPIEENSPTISEEISEEASNVPVSPVEGSTITPIVSDVIGEQLPSDDHQGMPVTNAFYALGDSLKQLVTLGARDPLSPYTLEGHNDQQTHIHYGFELFDGGNGLTITKTMTMDAVQEHKDLLAFVYDIMDFSLKVSLNGAEIYKEQEGGSPDISRQALLLEKLGHFQSMIDEQVMIKQQQLDQQRALAQAELDQQRKLQEEAVRISQQLENF